MHILWDWQQVHWQITNSVPLVHLNVFHILEEAQTDRLQGLLRPLVEPVNGGAVDHSWELPAANPQRAAHGWEAERHLSNQWGTVGAQSYTMLNECKNECKKSHHAKAWNEKLVQKQAKEKESKKQVQESPWWRNGERLYPLPVPTLGNMESVH